MRENDVVGKIPKKYRTRFWIGMVGYVISILFCTVVVTQIETSPLSYALILIPIVPVSYGMFNTYLGVRELDELERRIQMEGVMIAALVAGVIAFTWGLLEYASLVPHFHTFLFAPIMIATWGIATSFIRRRYA